MFENYPFVAFFHLFCYVLNEESVSEETKTLNEVIVGLRDLQSHKSHSARSCSPLPVACALMATIEKAKTQGEDEDQDLFKDFNDTEGINSSKLCLSKGRLYFRRPPAFPSTLSILNLH